MKSKPAIPVYKISDRSSKGILIRHFGADSLDRAYLETAHRDDHYVLVFQRGGESSLIVDFKRINLIGTTIFIILPGQVHYGLAAGNASVYLLAIDQYFVDQVFHPVFHDIHGNPEPISITEDKGKLMENTILLLDNILRNADRDQFYEGNLQGIAKSYLSFFASSYHNHKKSVFTDDSRPTIITRAFFDQLHANFKTVKSPSQYASLLSITPAYLNEAVKNTTGKTVSLWIKERVITEAKRILSHTRLSVKEVSLELGYSDWTYFIRIFGKSTGKTPGQFRKENTFPTSP
ncbi:helix-turn-helix domain-containing protein [Pedobacter jeongneungensis]|uniref:helix-turn-helix domain-containing protein n=1 Tax=Pedobacter jeongneungensis TaxID=947309 RepID=UPI000468E254|nr:AraC family transcriptional regulator [Pedobacter jeongneungensis]